MQGGRKLALGFWGGGTENCSCTRLLNSPCAAAGHHPPRSNGHHNNTQELLDILEPILNVIPRPIVGSCARLLPYFLTVLALRLHEHETSARHTGR